MQRLAAIASAVALVGAGALPALGGASDPPHRIPLPAGFRPEGIAVAGDDLFVGSIPTGAIYKAAADTGEGSVFVPARKGRSAIGLSVARHTLFVAGGETGRAYVYDTRSGDEKATYRLTTGATFVNDVIATKEAAWFTDSVNPVLYRIPLHRDGTPGDASDVEKVALSGDIRYRSGFNVNGIEATPDGEHLIIVQSNTGQLFDVDADSGEASRIALDGQRVPNGDGLLLDDRCLLVVQNMLNRVAVVKLDEDHSSGEVVERLTDPGFDVPTTIAAAGDWLYAVNARFSTTPTPTTRYWVTVVPEP
jgi:sugar lactone lactonase YvrE